MSQELDRLERLLDEKPILVKTFYVELSYTPHRGMPSRTIAYRNAFRELDDAVNVLGARILKVEERFHNIDAGFGNRTYVGIERIVTYQEVDRKG